MKIYHGFDDRFLKKKSRSVAIGIFDGVHRGHQKILKKMLAAGHRMRSGSMVVTFEPHPDKILQPRQKHPILMSLPHRLRLFERLGVSETLVIRFNRAFSKISHETFLNRYLINRIGMGALFVGRNFRFGSRALGNGQYLKEKSKTVGFKFFGIEPVKLNGEIVSSTSIRRLIERGQLSKASKMLGRPVSVYGTVVPGRGRGRRIGFPTANLNPHHETLPPSGVYAAWGRLDGQLIKGVIHIGQRPTFGEREKTLEVHFLNFHKDLYGKELELLFVKRLRSIRRFRNAADLVKAIQKDIQKARAIL